MEKKKIKKVLKIILVIAVIVLALFLINTFRKFIIIKKSQQNISTYVSSTNYHIKSVATEDTGEIVTINYYQKDGKQAAIIERNNNGEISEISMYNNGERTDIFYENSKGKIAQLNTGTTMEVNIYNYFETENDWQTLIGSITAQIKKTEYKGKECYIVNNFLSPMFLNGKDKNEVYIEKDTGLYIKSTIDSIVTEREYEFENVSDTVFVEPDIGQYRIQ